MLESNDPCDRKPLIALWFLHKTTEMLGEATRENLKAAIDLQTHYICLCRKYGVTVEQVSDSLDITYDLAYQLMMSVHD